MLRLTDGLYDAGVTGDLVFRPTYSLINQLFDPMIARRAEGVLLGDFRTHSTATIDSVLGTFEKYVVTQPEFGGASELLRLLRKRQELLGDGRERLSLDPELESLLQTTRPTMIDVMRRVDINSSSMRRALSMDAGFVAVATALEICNECIALNVVSPRAREALVYWNYLAKQDLPVVRRTNAKQTGLSQVVIAQTASALAKRSGHNAPITQTRVSAVLRKEKRPTVVARAPFVASAIRQLRPDEPRFEAVAQRIDEFFYENRSLYFAYQANRYRKDLRKKGYGVDAQRGSLARVIDLFSWCHNGVPHQEDMKNSFDALARTREMARMLSDFGVPDAKNDLRTVSEIISSRLLALGVSPKKVLGISWTEIAVTLQVSRQAVHQAISQAGSCKPETFLEYMNVARDLGLSDVGVDHYFDTYAASRPKDAEAIEQGREECLASRARLQEPIGVNLSEIGLKIIPSDRSMSLFAID